MMGKMNLFLSGHREYTQNFVKLCIGSTVGLCHLNLQKAKYNQDGVIGLLDKDSLKINLRQYLPVQIPNKITVRQKAKKCLKTLKTVQLIVILVY